MKGRVAGRVVSFIFQRRRRIGGFSRTRANEHRLEIPGDEFSMPEFSSRKLAEVESSTASLPEAKRIFSSGKWQSPGVGGELGWARTYSSGLSRHRVLLRDFLFDSTRRDRVRGPCAVLCLAKLCSPLCTCVRMLLKVFSLFPG